MYRDRQMMMNMEEKGMAYFTDYDSYLFHNGTNYELYKKLGPMRIRWTG